MDIDVKDREGHSLLIIASSRGGGLDITQFCRRQAGLSRPRLLQKRTKVNGSECAASRLGFGGVTSAFAGCRVWYPRKRQGTVGARCVTSRSAASGSTLRDHVGTFGPSLRVKPWSTFETEKGSPTGIARGLGPLLHSRYSLSLFFRSRLSERKSNYEPNSVHLHAFPSSHLLLSSSVLWGFDVLTAAHPAHNCNVVTRHCNHCNGGACVVRCIVNVR